MNLLFYMLIKIYPSSDDRYEKEMLEWLGHMIRMDQTWWPDNRREVRGV
jgi:hypothetical protein